MSDISKFSGRLTYKPIAGRLAEYCHAEKLMTPDGKLDDHAMRKDLDNVIAAFKKHYNTDDHLTLCKYLILDYAPCMGHPPRGPGKARLWDETRYNRLVGTAHIVRLKHPNRKMTNPEIARHIYKEKVFAGFSALEKKPGVMLGVTTLTKELTNARNPRINPNLAEYIAHHSEAEALTELAIHRLEQMKLRAAADTAYRAVYSRYFKGHEALTNIQDIISK